MAFVKVANTEDVRPGGAIAVRTQGKELALFNVEGSFYCIDNACPHLEGPLSEGYLEKDVVLCPWHAWQINVRTGEVLYSPGLCMATYSCKVEGNAVLIDI